MYGTTVCICTYLEMHRYNRSKLCNIKGNKVIRHQLPNAEETMNIEVRGWFPYVQEPLQFVPARPVVLSLRPTSLVPTGTIIEQKYRLFSGTLELMLTGIAPMISRQFLPHNYFLLQN